jgi:hypothetical protein
LVESAAGVVGRWLKEIALIERYVQVSQMPLEWHWDFWDDVRESAGYVRMPLWNGVRWQAQHPSYGMDLVGVDDAFRQLREFMARGVVASRRSRRQVNKLNRLLRRLVLKEEETLSVPVRPRLVEKMGKRWWMMVSLQAESEEIRALRREICAGLSEDCQ